MSYQITDSPAMLAAGAIPMYTAVVQTTTANTCDVAVGNSTKIIGYAENEAFAAGDAITVKLIDCPRVGIASEAIAVGDFVEITASGKYDSVVGPTNLVAATAAAADGEYLTVYRCGAKTF